MHNWPDHLGYVYVMRRNQKRRNKIKKCRRHLNGRASRRHLNGRNDGAARMNLASSEKERTEEACNG